MILGGIDEAGRGAIIGPLVVAGVFLHEERLSFLAKIGVKDSKKLSFFKREIIFEAFKRNRISFHFFEILPEAIDKTSINELEVLASAKIVRDFQRKYELCKLFLDVPAFGRGIENYCKKLKDNLKDDSIEIIGGNKMDELHLVVSAASIVAKVMRDRKIHQLKKKYGDFGSGYPNTRTVDYIKKYYSLVKPVVRHKWKTLERIQTSKEGGESGIK